MSRLHPLFAGVMLLLVSLPEVAFACIWVDGSSLDGHPKRHGPRLSLERLWGSMAETPENKIKALGIFSSSEGVAGREREAVKMMLSGSAAAAIPLLLINEDESPKRYSTAANLGTAYELAGDNQNALKWIAEGIRRNPESHEGTEWLHNLILETKLRLEKDPDYLKTHRIIPLPEKFDAKTKINIGGVDRGVFDIVWAIHYQLEERAVFVKPPDPIVADLLFSYALCEARLGVLESSLELLKKSEEYGFAEPDLIKATADKYQLMVEKAQRERAAKAMLLKFGAPLFLVAILVLIIYWRRRKHLARKNVAL